MTLALRIDPMNPTTVDASRFLRARVPTCQVGTMNDLCWSPPAGVTPTCCGLDVSGSGPYDASAAALAERLVGATSCP